RGGSETPGIQGAQTSHTASPGRTPAHHADGVRDPALASLRPNCRLDRLHVLALVGEAELLPPLPGRRRGAQGSDQVARRRDLTLFFVEIEEHAHALASLEAGRFAVAPA